MSTLNPNYTPNLIEYRKTQEEKDIAYDTDEDEEENIDKNFQDIFLQKEKEIDYRSSDEEVDISQEVNYLLDDDENHSGEEI